MVPVPVPVFIPIPLHLYTQYAPVPFGIPVPVSNHLEIKANIVHAHFPQLRFDSSLKNFLFVGKIHLTFTTFLNMEHIKDSFYLYLPSQRKVMR